MGGSGNYDPYRKDLAFSAQPSSERDCMAVRFSTILQQPVNAPTHAEGTVFELLRVATSGATAIAAIDDDGQIVGTVVEELADLLRCTASGVAYVAYVTSVSNGIHTVSVRAADVTMAEAGTYRASGVASAITDKVELEPAPMEVGAEIVVGTNRLVRAGVCEIRSLVRVGVIFDATVQSDGAVTVAASGP